MKTYFPVEGKDAERGRSMARGLAGLVSGHPEVIFANFRDTNFSAAMSICNQNSQS